MSADDMAEILRAYYRQRVRFGNESHTSLEADSAAWFEGVKELAGELGYCPDTKLYRSEPEKWKGSVGDVSMAIRIAVCGRQQSPDLYEVMRVMCSVDGGLFIGRLKCAAEALGADTAGWDE